MSNPSAGGAVQPAADYTWTGTHVFNGPVSFAGGGASGTAGASVTAAESAFGAFHSTVLTLTGMPMALSDTNVGGGSKIYTFPKGNITIVGATCAVAETTTSTLASTLNASVTLSVGVGSIQTTTQGSGTLVTTQQDVCQAFAATSSATINVPGAVANGKLSVTTLTRYDGTTTAQPLWLNCGVPTGTDIDGDATTTWSGTVTVVWIYDGTY